MIQATTPENLDDAITAATTAATTAETVHPSAVPGERRRCFEVVINFADTDGVGECMLALNKRCLVYTNSAEPIEEWEHVVSGTVSGAVELAADEDDKEAIDKAFDLVGSLVEPFGGECTECRFVDQLGRHPGITGSF
jgi:hypothetical protein